MHIPLLFRLRPWGRRVLRCIFYRLGDGIAFVTRWGAESLLVREWLLCRRRRYRYWRAAWDVGRIHRLMCGSRWRRFGRCVWGLLGRGRGSSIRFFAVEKDEITMWIFSDWVFLSKKCGEILYEIRTRSYKALIMKRWMYQVKGWMKSYFLRVTHFESLISLIERMLARGDISSIGRHQFIWAYQRLCGKNFSFLQRHCAMFCLRLWLSIFLVLGFKFVTTSHIVGCKVTPRLQRIYISHQNNWIHRRSISRVLPALHSFL